MQMRLKMVLSHLSMIAMAGTLVACANKTPAPNAPLSAEYACHPSYSGACVPAGVSNVDCVGEGGSGPAFVSGPLRVVGPDKYNLDRDGDGIACEP